MYCIKHIDNLGEEFTWQENPCLIHVSCSAFNIDLKVFDTMRLNVMEISGSRSLRLKVGYIMIEEVFCYMNIYEYETDYPTV